MKAGLSLCHHRPIFKMFSTNRSSQKTPKIYIFSYAFYIFLYICIRCYICFKHFLHFHSICFDIFLISLRKFGCIRTSCHLIDAACLLAASTKWLKKNIWTSNLVRTSTLAFDPCGLFVGRIDHMIKEKHLDAKPGSDVVAFDRCSLFLGRIDQMLLKRDLDVEFGVQTRFSKR